MTNIWPILGSLVMIAGLILFGYVMGFGVGYRTRMQEETSSVNE